MANRLGHPYGHQSVWRQPPSQGVRIFGKNFLKKNQIKKKEINIKTTRKKGKSGVSVSTTIGNHEQQWVVNFKKSVNCLKTSVWRPVSLAPNLSPPGGPHFKTFFKGEGEGGGEREVAKGGGGLKREREREEGGGRREGEGGVKGERGGGERNAIDGRPISTSANFDFGQILGCWIFALRKREKKR